MGGFGVDPKYLFLFSMETAIRNASRFTVAGENPHGVRYGLWYESFNTKKGNPVLTEFPLFFAGVPRGI